MKTYKVSMTLTLTSELMEWLRSKSAESDRTIQEIITDLIQYDYDLECWMKDNPDKL